MAKHRTMNTTKEVKPSTGMESQRESKMVQRNKTIDSKEYEDLTHKQKNILYAASGCDKSNTEIGREVKASLAYVAEVLNNYGHMLPLNETPEKEDDGGEEESYKDLTITQQDILDIHSSGIDSVPSIAKRVGCSKSYAYKTLSEHQSLAPTSECNSEQPEQNTNKAMVTDGGAVEENQSNASVSITIQCSCGEEHEVNIE